MFNTLCRLLPAALVLSALWAAPSPAAEPTSATVKGTVTDEASLPVANVFTYLSSPRSGGYDAKTPQTRTDAKGAYSITVADPADVAAIEVSSPKAGLEGMWKKLTLNGGDDVKVYVVLPASRVAVVAYAFQPNGTRDFTAGVTAGTIKLKRPDFGFLFAKGSAHATSAPDDLRLECQDGEWMFINFHVRNKNGFYDAGEVKLDSVKEAAEAGYTPRAKPCVVGHTYVVRTIEGKYAKFHVKSLEKAGATTATPVKK